MQMLHQHAMLKRLQELQRHQQLQEFSDGRQQNYLNELSAMNKQASGGQFQPPINGTPIHNASQMFMVGNMNMVQRGASPAVQGFPNGLYFQAQSQDMRSMDVSLFQTPISSAINNLHQHSHIQGLSHDSENGLKGSVNQAEKPIMQSSGFSNSFLGGGTCTVSLDQLCNPDEALLSKQLFDGKNLLGHTTHQGFNSGILPENFQQVNTLQRNASARQFSGRQDQAGWPGLFPEKTAQLDPSQGPTTLDPLEQKILFNMHDNSWNDSFGRNSSIGTGGCDEVLECTDYVSSFPSIQSGSWSALMQSAVGEASSSDNVLQEEWSGLSFQNTELSTDNQPSTFVDRGKNQTSWVDNNVQSASSLGSKAQLLLNNSNRNSCFPVFQQSDSQFSVKHREGMHCDSSPESVQQSPKIAVKWLDCNTRQNQSIEESQLLHTMSPLENARRGQSLEHIEGYAHQHGISSYKNSHQPCNQLIESQIESPSPSDSFRLNVLQHTITEHEAGENMWLHGKDKSVAGGYQKSSGQGHLSEIRNSKASEELRPRASSGANTSASFDLTSQTRQDMLEHLHKLDHVREQGTVAHFSPADSNPLLVVPEAEIAEASMVKPFDRSFISQRTDLRLAPPTQRPTSNSFFPSQSSPKMDNSNAASPTGPFYLQNQLQKHHLPAAPVATQSPEATLSDMAKRLPHFNCDTSLGNSQPNLFNPSGLFPILEDVPVGQPSLMSGLSKQVGSSTRSPHLWTNVSTQPHLSGTEALKVPSNFLVSADSMNKSVQTTSWATQELHDQNSHRVTPSHDWGACPMMSQGFESGEEHPGKDRSHQQITPEILDQGLHTDGLAHDKGSVPRCLSETNASGSGSWMTRPLNQDFDRARHGGSQSPAVSARDLQAFGRSLEPSNLQQTYSLLHLMHSVKNVETDPCKMVSENNLGTGPDLNVQQLATTAEHQMMCGNNSGVRDPVNNGLNVASRINSFPTTDFKMRSFSSEVGEDQSTKASSLPLPQESPQEMVTPCQSYSQGHPGYDNVAVNRTQQSQISLQMATSWFKHYGTLRNGVVLPMYDARTAKNSVQQFFPGKTSENLHMTSSVGQVSAAGVADQNLTVMRPKKRKIGTCELLPWHKEVTQSSKRFKNISTAELEWAQATNRLAEKVEAQREIIDDMLPLLQPKKRIVLTTQLMQQLFRPAPASILSADASSNYNTVANFTAKLALGDACSLTTCSISDSCPSSNGYGTMSENHRTSKKIGDHCFSRIVEDFMKRAKKLESDFLRLDKATSVVDIRVECQDLEKFSVINRFAKFYCQGQPDAADTSSSSGTTPTALKSLPQRYVIAFPMPKAVPKVEQCFSL